MKISTTKPNLFFGQGWLSDGCLIAAEPGIDTRTLPKDLSFRVVKETIEGIIIILILGHEHLFVCISNVRSGTIGEEPPTLS